VRDTSSPPNRRGDWGAASRPAQADLAASLAGGLAQARPAQASTAGNIAPGIAHAQPEQASTALRGRAGAQPPRTAAGGSLPAETSAAARRGGTVSGPAAAWLLIWLLSLVAYVIVGWRDAMLFYLVWVGSAALWGFRISGVKPTLSVLAAMIATAVAAAGLDAAWPTMPAERVVAALLMAGVFIAIVWHVHRRQSADAERARVSEENARLLASQRRFLQDASHQLRTPITIALGHAELLARELADGTQQRDIHVVVGELARLKRLSERLLLIASSEDREYLRVEPVELDSFILEVLRRWLPAAQRQWRLEHLDPVTMRADRERLGLAVDALLENAVQHTKTGDEIRLSVLRDGPAAARLVVEDNGEGIPPGELESIFERFRTGSDGGSRRTGLGLALVRAVARGHGGEVRVRSAPGTGSRFELVLPENVPPGDAPQSISEPAQPAESWANVNRP
jgi:two-component system, OmpR family, sensor kinase